jgi:hypothetical protein
MTSICSLVGPPPWFIRDAEGQDAAAVRALPPEELFRQSLFVRAGPHKDIGLETALLEHLGQGACMAEAVHAVSHGRLHAQSLAHVSLAEKDLAHDRLALGQVHIGLDDHAINDVPASLLDQRQNLGEEPGILLLDPFVDLRLAAHEVEIGVFAKPIGRGKARGQRLGPPFGPAPQPHRIEVRLADHVDNGLAHRIAPSCAKRRQALPAAVQTGIACPSERLAP